MSSVVKIFRDLLLLRGGPQDLPYSLPMLVALALACIAAQTGIYLIQMPVGLGESFLSAMLETLLILAALHAVLRMRKLDNRFVQTASGLLGCNLIFMLVRLPLTLAVGRLPLEDGLPAPEHATPTQMFLSPLVVAFYLWQLSAVANVLRHGLNMNLAGGIALLLGWLLLFPLLLAVVTSLIL